MMQRLLLTAALALVAGTGAYMSVYGLAAVFAAAPIVAICLGLGLELGKLMTVVHLHRRWKAMPAIGRTFYMAVAAVLMVMTASEAAGFLLQSYTQDTAMIAVNRAARDKLAAEAVLLQNRIAVIDDTLAGLPEGYVSRRIAERDRAGYAGLQDRLLVVTGEQQGLSVAIARDEAAAGPMIALAGMAGWEPARAATIFILLIVCVMEPLGLGLAVAVSASFPAEKRAGKLYQTAEDGAAEQAADDDGGPTDEAADETRLPHETADTADVSAVKAADAADPLTIELAEIIERHNLRFKDVANIVDRRQPDTVRLWLSGDPVIPIKALRLLRRWAARQPPMRLIKKSSAGGES